MLLPLLLSFIDRVGLRNVLATCRQCAARQVQSVFVSQNLEPRKKPLSLSIPLKPQEVASELSIFGLRIRSVCKWLEALEKFSVAFMVSFEPLANRCLARVSKRVITKIVDKSAVCRYRSQNSFLVFVCQNARFEQETLGGIPEAPSHTGNFHRMRQTRSNSIVSLQRKDLGLILEPTDGSRKHSPPVVAVELASQIPCNRRGRTLSKKPLHSLSG